MIPDSPSEKKADPILLIKHIPHVRVEQSSSAGLDDQFIGAPDDGLRDGVLGRYEGPVAVGGDVPCHGQVGRAEGDEEEVGP